MAQTLTLANLKKAMEQNNSTLKEWINTQLANMSTFNIVWVEELPTEDISTSTIYMLKNTESTDENNIYDEYAYNETTGWEIIGSLNTGAIDLSEYYNKTETYSKEEIDKLLSDITISISTEENNAISQKEDGIFVEDKSTELKALTNRIDEIKKYQKYVNTDLGYGYFQNNGESVITNVSTNILAYLTDRISNLEITENGYVKLEKGHNYFIYGTFYKVTAASGLTFKIIDSNNNILNDTCYGAGPDFVTNGLNYISGELTEDTYIGIVPEKTVGLNLGFCTIAIQEIGRQIVIDPTEHINTTQGLEDTPVGHIISHMGNNAPKHYLICDGSEYNISEYPYLAQHFIDEFGTANYFGGDGETTFAVPDLRGEFLRGTGTALRNTGSGGDVGEHQDGTITDSFTRVSNGAIGWANTTLGSKNVDKIINQYTSIRNSKSFTDAWTSSLTFTHTSRPTNTAVLYCIKYEPTYFMNIHGLRTETVLFEGNYVSGTCTLSESIENYDQLEFYVASHAYSNIVSTKEITYQQAWNIGIEYYPSGDYTKGKVACHFDDAMTVAMDYNGISSYNQGITKIVGIKYYTENGTSNGSSITYTDEEVNAEMENIFGGEA